MPAVSTSQQKLMGADLERKRAGKKPRTGMSAGQLEHFAKTKHKGLPNHARRDRIAAIRSRSRS